MFKIPSNLAKAHALTKDVVLVLTNWEFALYFRFIKTLIDIFIFFDSFALDYYFVFLLIYFGHKNQQDWNILVKNEKIFPEEFL